MFTTRFFYLSAFAALLSLSTANVDSTCYSYGVDFVDDDSYFINTLSSDPFTCVSTFSGCNPSTAEVLLIDPNGDEQFCSQLATTPGNSPVLSTCPILKNQMFSGTWMILVLGNNGDGNPFAWERDLQLDCGPQATTTATQTVTVVATEVPTSTSTSVLVIVSSLSPTKTHTVPTATRVKTITPTTTTTVTKKYTKMRTSWTKSLQITTKTVTASCTLPSKPQPDKPCTYHPTLIHPAALATPTKSPKFHRYARKADRAVDIEYARNRIAAAKLKRDSKANIVAAPLEGRAPDAPTSTVIAPTPAVTTSTFTAPAVVETAFSTTTSVSQLPDVTVFSGVAKSTKTLPPVIKTRYIVQYTTGYTTKTIKATWTRTTTTTPAATKTACKKLGGHIGSGRR